MNLQTIQVSTTFENTSKMKKFFTIFIPLCVITVSCVILSTRESNYLFGKKAEVKKPRQQSFEEIFAPKKEVINSLARTFKYQPDYDWCVKRGSFDESSPSGLLFVKVPKTGKLDAKDILHLFVDIISHIYSNYSIEYNIWFSRKNST